MLVDDGLLRRDDGTWTATADLTRIAVPPTVHALLAARLDRLEEGERLVIQRGSVEGQVFHRRAVAELSPDEARDDVRSRLLTLTRKELLRPDRPAFPGDEAFRFRHLLIRDAAYEAMSKETRAELHERFAAWLERRAGERGRERAQQRRSGEVRADEAAGGADRHHALEPEIEDAGALGRELADRRNEERRGRCHDGKQDRLRGGHRVAPVPTRRTR